MAKTKPAKLRIIPLGGVDGIGENLTVFEYKDDILLVDCGIAFPEENMLGVDYVIPDTTYLEKNKEKVKGLVLTHGHEDHIGAVPYFLRLFKVPIYGTRLTLGILKNKLAEHGLLEVTELIEVNAGDNVNVGCFNVELIRVNHSIADAVALAINTPYGMVIHSGDFKIDFTPIQGLPIDLCRFAHHGTNGVKLFMCESTNVERAGFTPTERAVGTFFDRIFTNLDKRVVIATFSSNVHRVQQIINASVKCGRKIAITGRSMLNVIKAATELNYMQIPEGILIDINDMKRYKPSQLTLITTGSQGEPMSALYRMAFGEHNLISLGATDCVILSSTPIPGNEKTVSRIINELLKRGVQVLNDHTGDVVHVSGHACQEEIKILHSLVKPEYFIPIHGEYKHLKRHAELAETLGMDPSKIIIPEIGKVIEIDKKGMRSGENVPSGQILVDGYGVGDIGSAVLRDRKHLAEDGVMIIVASLDLEQQTIVAGPDITSRGFIYARDSESVMDAVNKLCAKTLTKCLDNGYIDFNAIKAKVRDDISSYLYSKVKRKPMIVVMLTDIRT